MSIPNTKDSQKQSNQEKTLRQLPAKEISWLKSCSPDGTIFFTTSNPERSVYFLYKKTTEGFVRVAKSANPKELDAIVFPPEVAPVEKVAKKRRSKGE